MTTYPRVPDFDPRLASEALYPFGARAFLYALEVSVGLLPTEALEAALHVSLVAVRGPDQLDSTREKFADVRRRLALALRDRLAAREQREQAQPEPEPPDSPEGPGGGLPVPRPTPPTRPTPPASRLPETLNAF